MLLRAKETGIVNGSRVRAGNVFDWPGENIPRWAEPADAPAPAETGEVVVAGKKAKKPQTLHDHVI